MCAFFARKLVGCMCTNILTRKLLMAPCWFCVLGWMALCALEGWIAPCYGFVWRAEREREREREREWLKILVQGSTCGAASGSERVAVELA